MEVVGYQYHDPVNHPKHYTTGKIETIDFIQDKKLNFARGNAVKYIIRAGLKDPDKEIEDLEKAIFYIKAEIKDIQARKKTDEETDAATAIRSFAEVARTIGIQP